MAMSRVNAISREFALQTYANEGKKVRGTVGIGCMVSFGMIAIYLR